MLGGKKIKQPYTFTLSKKTPSTNAMYQSLGKMPLSIRQRLERKDHIAIVRSSRRFSGADPAICEKVSRPGFVGYWVCKGTINATKVPPSEAIITLLWIHGGAYVAGSALSGLVSLLRVAELEAEQNLSLNIFTLEYSLAPEATFPTQMAQATAAYKYLIEEAGIDPNSVHVLGESAGGHLALALAYNLQQQGIPRPGRVGLLYPWVNLENTGSTFKTNKYKDCLVKEDMDKCVDWLLGRDGRLRFSHLMNFASSPPRVDLPWSQILPPTWVVIGGNDVLFSDVINFVDEARKDGVSVDLQVEAGMPHGWLAYFDALAVKQYLRLSPEDDAKSILVGSEVIAKAVCEHGHICKGQKGP